MNNIIRIKIDVTKIDKSRLFKGAKGTYLDAALIPSRDNQYGDSHFIVQDVSKEEREQGVKGAIIGNAKTFETQQQGNQGRVDTYANRADKGEVDPNEPQDDDVPF